MAYEIFLNAQQRPAREEVERALEQLGEVPELEVCELHELEDVVRAPEENVEDLEWLLQVEEGLAERYRAFCSQHGLNGALEPLDPAAASRFMEELSGFDFAVIQLPGGEGEESDPKPVVAAWRALVAFAKQHGYRLMDPQFNDPGQFVDLKAPGALPPGYD